MFSGQIFQWCKLAVLCWNQWTHTEFQLLCMWLHTSFVNQLRCAIRLEHGPFPCWNKALRAETVCSYSKRGQTEKPIYKGQLETQLGSHSSFSYYRSLFHTVTTKLFANKCASFLLWHSTIKEEPSLPCGTSTTTVLADCEVPTWAPRPHRKLCHSLKPGGETRLQEKELSWHFYRAKRASGMDRTWFSKSL